MIVQEASNVLMCMFFTTTFRDAAWAWCTKLQPNSISSFKEFGKNSSLSSRVVKGLERAPTFFFLLLGGDKVSPRFFGSFSSGHARGLWLELVIMMSALLKGLRVGGFFHSLSKRFLHDLSKILSHFKRHINIKEGMAKKRKERREHKHLQESCLFLLISLRSKKSDPATALGAHATVMWVYSIEHFLGVDSDENKESRYHPLAWKDEQKDQEGSHKILPLPPRTWTWHGRQFHLEEGDQGPCSPRLPVDLH